jgi:hypothetical protein
VDNGVFGFANGILKEMQHAELHMASCLPGGEGWDTTRAVFMTICLSLLGYQ